MYDLNSTEPACASLLKIGDSNNLQSHEPVNSRPAAVDRVTEFELFGGRMDERLHQANPESTQSGEDRYRNLFGEAPIAYLFEGIDPRTIQANHTAMRILGVRPEESPGMLGKSCLTRQMLNTVLRDAFEPVTHGNEMNGAVLKLHRKDDHRPIWIQCCSRPVSDARIYAPCSSTSRFAC